MVAVFCFFANLLLAQDLPPVSTASDYAHLRVGVNPPRLLHSFDPEYTPQATAAGIEGTVVLQAVIDAKGNVAYASVLSPLPAGLDRSALAVVKRWRYSPGEMDRELIPVLTTIDIRFQLPYELAKLKASRHNDAQAIFFLAKAQPGGEERWKLMRKAAYFGSSDAQVELGDKSLRAGQGNDAKWYFRLCAATAHAYCEYQLGRLMVSGPGMNPNDFSQGVAWLELAKGHGNQDAERLWLTSAANLSSIQVDWVAQLKPHLELKDFRGF